MLGQDPVLCRCTQSASSGLGPGIEHIENIVGPLGENDVTSWLEQGLYAIPDVRDDGGFTGRCLEQANARTIARADHVGPRHVKRIAALSIESRMVPWGNVIDPLHVRRPVYVRWVLRTCYNEAQMRRLPCRLDQKPLQGRLPVGAVGSEIAEIP